MSKIPLFTQTSDDWHCNKNLVNKPLAVGLNAGTNEYIFGRVTPNNKFIVSTGLINSPNSYGVQMVGGNKKKGGASLNPAVYNNYAHNELIYNALSKINQLNGLNSPCKNSMIDAQNNITGGAKNTKKKSTYIKKKSDTKKKTETMKKPDTKKKTETTKKPDTKKKTEPKKKTKTKK